MACSREEHQHEEVESRRAGGKARETLSRVLERSTGEDGRPKGPSHLEDRQGTASAAVDRTETGEKKRGGNTLAAPGSLASGTWWIEALASRNLRQEVAGPQNDAQGWERLRNHPGRVASDRQTASSGDRVFYRRLASGGNARSGPEQKITAIGQGRVKGSDRGSRERKLADSDRNERHAKGRADRKRVKTPRKQARPEEPRLERVGVFCFSGAAPARGNGGWRWEWGVKVEGARGRWKGRGAGERWTWEGHAARPVTLRPRAPQDRDGALGPVSGSSQPATAGPLATAAKARRPGTSVPVRS